MKPNIFNSLISSITATAFLLGTASSQAQVTVYAEYRLGETGSLSGTNKLPQDSSGNVKHFTSDVGGSAATIGTAGVSAPGSTEYLDTTAAGNQGWFANNLLTTGIALPTNNFACGIYARAAGNTNATVGDVFTLNGGPINGTPKISLTNSGWQASFHNQAFVGGTGTFAANTWVHLALIRSGGATAFYVNGVQLGGTTALTPVIGSPHIGINPGNSGNTFDGHIDEARIVTFPSTETTANILAALTTVYLEPVGANGTWTSTVSGNWSVSSNWQSSVIATSSNNTATFNAGSGPIMVTLDSNRKIGNLAFSNADYTIGGANLLTLNSGSTPGISVAADRVATLSTNIGGTLGFEKTGLGTVILSGPSNSNSGATMISEGAVQVGDGSTTGALPSGNVSIAGSLVFNRSNAYGTGAAQVFSGAGTIIKNGAGDLVFNGVDSHTNVQGISNVVVNGGLVRTDSFGKWNSSLNLTVNSPGKFEIWNTSTSIGNLSGNGIVQSTTYYGRTNTITIAAGTFSGTITDLGITTGAPGSGDTRINLVKSSAGTLTLSGVTSYNGNTTVSEGTLSLGNGTTQTNLSNFATVDIAFGSTVDLNFTGSDEVGKLIIDGETLPPGVYDSSVATPVEYRSYFTGTGSLTVLGQSGTWISAVNGNWGSSSNWQSGLIATGYDKTATFGVGSGPITVTLDTSRVIGNLAFSSADYTIGGAQSLFLESEAIPSISVSTGRVATLVADVSGTIGFEKTGDGLLILNGASNNCSGEITIGGGNLQIGSSGRLGGGTSANAFSIASGSTLQYSGSANQIFSGSIFGDGGFTKDTANSDLTLSNSGNSYIGTTTVSAGRILISSGGQLSNGATSIMQSGTGQIFINSIATISNPFNISTTGYLNPGDSQNNIDGGIRLNGGTLSGQITLSGNSRIGAATTIPGTLLNTISGQITGAYGIDFYGFQTVNSAASVFALSNTENNYTGNTTILNSNYNSTNRTGVSTTLMLNASEVIPNAVGGGNVVFAINGTNNNAVVALDLNGFSETINGLTVGAGTFTQRITNSATGSSVLTIGANDTTSSFSGTITDAGLGKTLAITKTGNGTLTLSGSNNYIGATSVSAGTLALVGGNQASAITVNSGASLGFTLASPVTSTSTVNLTNGTVKITGVPSAASHLLMTAAGGITGTPTLFVAIPGYSLVKTNGNTELRLNQAAGYSSWQAANGTTQSMDLDHDNDGVSNGVEFFLGGTANTTGFTTPMPAVVSDGGVLSVTWTKAATYPVTAVYGTDYWVETSDTLIGSWTAETVGGGNIALSGNNVKYTFPSPLGSKKFARLIVTGL